MFVVTFLWADRCNDYEIANRQFLLKAADLAAARRFVEALLEDEKKLAGLLGLEPEKGPLEPDEGALEANGYFVSRFPLIEEVVQTADGASWVRVPDVCTLVLD